MNTPTIKLIAFDLDGTIAESKQRVTAEMGNLLADLMKKMPVAIMSGASFAQFETQFLPAIPYDAQLDRMYLFPVNAAQCFVYAQNRWRPAYDLSLTTDEKKHIIQALNDSLVEVGIEVPPQVWGERIEDRIAQITFSALGQKAPLKEKKVWDPDRKKRMHLRDAMLRRLRGFTVSVGGATSVDVTREGVSKAYGMRQLSEMTGIQTSEMLYVGDALEPGGNDAVVKESGVQTHGILCPSETTILIKSIIAEKEIPISNKDICE